VIKNPVSTCWSDSTLWFQWHRSRDVRRRFQWLCSIHDPPNRDHLHRRGSPWCDRQSISRRLEQSVKEATFINPFLLMLMYRLTHLVIFNVNSSHPIVAGNHISQITGVTFSLRIVWATVLGSWWIEVWASGSATICVIAKLKREHFPSKNMYWFDKKMILPGERGIHVYRAPSRWARQLSSLDRLPEKWTVATVSICWRKHHFSKAIQVILNLCFSWSAHLILTKNTNVNIPLEGSEQRHWLCRSWEHKLPWMPSFKLL